MGLLTQPISCLGLPVCVAPLWPDGLPGASSPAPGDGSGPRLPIGVQLIAPPWREDICLRVAAELERRGIARARINA